MSEILSHFFCMISLRITYLFEMHSVTMENKNIINLCLFLITLSFSSGNQPLFEACNMLIAIDERLYDHFNRDIDNVTSMVKDLVNNVNKVYQK